jgi:hypothetical protein
MTTLVARASESLHWYNRDGSPQYTVKAKNGNDRSTTLRDARTMSLVPSVTTIIKSAASPGLEAWKLNQMLLAALTLPRAPDEPETSFVQRVIADSKEHAKMAAERGTKVHTAVEAFYSGIMQADMMEYQIGVGTKLEDTYGITEFEPEKSFAHELGFGGKLDLFSRTAFGGKGLVIDIKSKEFTDPDKVDAYDEHMMQLAAYRIGLGLPNARCANVFASASNHGLIKIHEWSEEELQRGWAMFQALLTFWKLKNKFGE